MKNQPVQTTSKSKKQLIWGLVCLLGPTALIIVSILLFAIANFIFGSTAQPNTNDADLFMQQSPAQTVSNVILFVVGTLGVTTWLPGIIAGIILLANRK